MEDFAIFLTILYHIGPIWTNLDHYVYFDLSIWTCHFETYIFWHFTNYATRPWLSLFCPWLSLFCPWLSLFCPWLPLVCPCLSLVCPWLSLVCPCLSGFSPRMSLVRLIFLLSSVIGNLAHIFLIYSMIDYIFQKYI